MNPQGGQGAVTLDQARELVRQNIFKWDKVPGLGHNCERMPDGGREVVFVSGNGSYIHGTNWAAFVDGQRMKLAELKERRMKGSEQSAPGYRR